MNLEQAKRASKKGAYTAFLLAGLGFVAISYHILIVNDLNPTPYRKSLADPLNYFSCLIYIILGFKLLKFSRLSALLSLLLVIGSLTFGMISSFGLTSILILLLIIYFFGNALRGTFTYHRLRKKEDPHYRQTPKWQYFLGIPAGLFIVVAFIYGFLIETGKAPRPEVLTGNQLKHETKETLRQKGILLKNERIDFFFSSGFLSILEEGNILTDKRVISYETIEGELIVYALSLDEVTKYEVVEKGDLFNNTVINVFSGEENWITLWLSADNNGDENFIEALSKRLKPDK